MNDTTITISLNYLNELKDAYHDAVEDNRLIHEQNEQLIKDQKCFEKRISAERHNFEQVKRSRDIWKARAEKQESGAWNIERAMIESLEDRVLTLEKLMTNSVQSCDDCLLDNGVCGY